MQHAHTMERAVLRFQVEIDFLAFDIWLQPPSQTVFRFPRLHRLSSEILARSRTLQELAQRKGRFRHQYASAKRAVETSK